MKKGNFEQTDFLDTLRYLNSKNINNSKELKDNFFDSLMVNVENIPEHIRGLAESWIKNKKKEYDGIARDWLLNNVYCTQASIQLTDGMIEDRIDSLYLDDREGHYTLMYIASVKGEKELVETHPEGFDYFKQQILLGLITRYANNIGTRAEDRIRLAKLVNMYIEQQIETQYAIEHKEQLESYIDDEFIEEIKKAKNGILGIDKILSILTSLLRRKTTTYRQITIEDEIEEVKRRLSDCTSQEEKYKLHKILEELYMESDYRYGYARKR